MQDIGGDLLGTNLFKHLHQFRRQLWLCAAQGTQFQGVSDHIVKAERPRPSVKVESFGLILRHLAVSLLIK